jgi:hypothetical protein
MAGEGAGDGLLHEVVGLDLARSDAGGEPAQRRVEGAEDRLILELPLLVSPSCSAHAVLRSVAVTESCSPPCLQTHETFASCQRIPDAIEREDRPEEAR